MTLVGRDDSARHASQVSPCGATSFAASAKEANRRRRRAPMGVPAHSRSSPGPPFTGDTPTPFRKSSSAQNTVPDFIPSGPLGPGAVQNFGLCHFTAAPGSDQPWQRVRDRGCAGRGRSKNRREGQAPPLRIFRKIPAEREGRQPPERSLELPWGTQAGRRLAKR